jgi:hypothetical protein
MCSKTMQLLLLCCHLVLVKTDSNQIPEMSIPDHPETGSLAHHHAEASILTKTEMDEIWKLIPASDDLDLILEDLQLTDFVDEKATSDESSFYELKVLFPDRTNSSEVG